MLRKLLMSKDCKDVQFLLFENWGGSLEIEAIKNNDNVGGCFINKNRGVYGHYGFFDGGFPDDEIEKFAQDVFNQEIEKLIYE